MEGCGDLMLMKKMEHEENDINVDTLSSGLFVFKACVPYYFNNVLFQINSQGVLTLHSLPKFEKSFPPNLSFNKWKK